MVDDAVCSFPVLLQLLCNFFFFPFLVVVSLFSWVCGVPVILVMNDLLVVISSSIFFCCSWSMVMSVAFCWVTCWTCSSCSFLSCVTLASIASRCRCHPSVMTLLMISWLLPFALMYLFLAMYVSSKNCWHCFHVLLLSLVSSHFVMVSLENQSNLHIWSIMWMTI